jgi:hypothetical protein
MDHVHNTLLRSRNKEVPQTNLEVLGNCMLGCLSAIALTLLFPHGVATYWYVWLVFFFLFMGGLTVLVMCPRTCTKTQSVADDCEEEDHDDADVRLQALLFGAVVTFYLLCLSGVIHVLQYGGLV